MNEDESKYDAVLNELTKLVGTWKDYQTQLGAEIVEYKKTVNNAISLLAQESMKFQSDTTKRLEADASERHARQAHVDRETQNVRADMLAARAETLERLSTTETNVRADMLAARAETLQRLDTTNALNEEHEKRAGRKSIALLSGVGCLILLNVVAIVALIGALIVLNWK